MLFSSTSGITSFGVRAGLVRTSSGLTITRNPEPFPLPYPMQLLKCSVEGSKEDNRPVASPPTGTVTFLFTDIEGSTKLWETNPKAMQKALARHDQILRRITEEHDGYVFKTVGDAFCCAFSTATDALEATLRAQRALFAEEWGIEGGVRVRMALHTGAAEERDGDYFGPPVNRVARLLSAGHGGQVLLSLPTQELVRDRLPPDVELSYLGERRLKDLFRPERVFQLIAPDVPSEFPPLRTLEGRPNNLPLQPTPLVGRQREVEEILERLRDEQARLLTLTGPGGTGKTRLALQVGADLLEQFDDGVFFVSLASVTDPELVLSTIAASLGVKEGAGQSLTETLEGYLHHKHLLLILDNFEQVLQGATPVGDLLGSCPKLKILLTSRIPLRLYGEQEYSVPPLEVPDPLHLPPLERLTQYEAVRLFIERARAVKPDFCVTNESAPAVAEICVRLDGLPLAIELAAARTKLLPPQALLSRLSNRLKLLKGGAINLPVRQQTLRATIDWSYDLLDEEEKTLFGRLCVFAGGSTLEAIEEVCDLEGDLDALEMVGSLLEKSLLRREEGEGAEPRFVMLETVHEYAREKLEESGQAEELKRRHAEYSLALADAANAELRGPEAPKGLERLEVEHDNMRAALAWALGQEKVELGLRLVGGLWRFWSVIGHYSEGRRWLEEALAMDGRGSMESRVMTLAGVGELSSYQGDLDRAEEALEEGLELLAREATGRSEAKLNLLLSLGHVALEREDLDRATEAFEESLALSREMGNDWGLAGSIMSLAIVIHEQGNLKRATELYEEGIDLFKERGDRLGLAQCLNNLGLVMYSRGDLGRAAKLTEESVSLLRELGAGADTAVGLCNLGWIALLQNNLGKASDLFNESLRLSSDTGMDPVVLTALEGFACAAGARGKAWRAVRLWGAAQALQEARGLPRDTDWLAEADALIFEVRSGLGEEAWEEALAEGREMTIEEAVSCTLEENGDR
jgi:predicted ATPase/class 3 adenylate cyclase/Tfp pilus assembly protein PilF